MYELRMITRSVRLAPLGVLATAILLGANGSVAAQEPEYRDDYDYDDALAQSGIQGSYGYFRVVDGTATLIQADTNERVRAQANEPVLVGDQVFLSGGSRAELLLADRSLVRIGDRAELGLRALAASPDSRDPVTVLELRRGTLQLVIADDVLGDDYPTIVTPNASVRVQARGSFLIVVDGDRRTEVVVREGRADVLTDADGADVRAGEGLLVEGRSGSRLRFVDAGGLDDLERWGQNFAYGDYDDYDYRDYVDSDLYYSSTTLSGHGSWVHVGGASAWRPYVSVGWSPYHHGRWRYSPTGLIWVSYEPWGWVPYHYGYWDYVGAYGWMWFPGRRFAPAHVYWYWGPSYAGWVPSGYYWRHYGHHYGNRFGFYVGVYGYVGGGYDHYRHWTFLPHRRFGHHRQHQYALNVHQIDRRGGRLERGILTTDTRALRPEVWRRPTEALSTLRRAGSRDGRTLADATPFVERRPRLPEALERVTLRSPDRGRTATPARGDRARIESRRPNVEARPDAPRLEGRGNPEAGRGVPRLQGRSAGAANPEARGREGGGATLRRPERPTIEGGVERRAGQQRLRRPTPGGDAAPRGEARSGERPSSRARPSARRPESGQEGPALRRPEVRSRSAPPAATPRTTPERRLRRPEVDSRGRSPEARPSAPTRSSRPQARPSAPTRSSRPQARPSAPTRSSRPQARPSAPTRSSRPQARPSAPTRSSRPQARPSAPTRSSRPQARPSAPTRSSRPQARPAPTRSSRPQARRSAPTRSSRPQARPAPTRSSRPQARPAPTRSSRPQARPAPTRSSRPSGSRSRAGRRP